MNIKKVLLGTTALVALSAGAALADSQGPAVTVGGFIDFQAGISDQDIDIDTFLGTAAPSRDVKFQNDTEIHVSVDGKTDNGLGYGAVVELEADVNSDADGEGLNADKTYIFLEGGFGRVELGNNTSPTDSMAVDAGSIARATGGIDGDFYDFSALGASIYTPDLPTAFFKGTGEDATKVTYYTPRFSGFQAGLSYTPDQGDGGTAAGFTGELGTDYEHVINAGLNYTGQFGDIGVAASATGELADNESSAIEDLEAYALGLSVSYAGFSVAGSYGDWQESLQAAGSSLDGEYWTLGAAYVTGPFGVSVTYLDSELNNVDFQNISVGADYQLAPGLVPYIEVSFFEDDSAVGTTSNGTPVVGGNDGTIVLVGTQLNF